MNRDYNDYTYMWWKDGFNKGDKEMLFQTGRYGLSRADRFRRNKPAGQDNRARQSRGGHARG